MRSFNRMVLVLLMGFSFAACERQATSPAGFRLPDGDAAAGRQLFAEMYCFDCHTVTGETFPESTLADSPNVVLGGERTRVTTYGELVTSIINPSHKLARGYPVDAISKDGESLMRNYNEFMTVQQLTDLVTFLQPHYKVVIPQNVYRRYR